MSRYVLGLGAAVLVASGTARADPPPLSTLVQGDAPEPPSATLPGYFNGLGTKGRFWVLQSDTTFNTNRVFTQRLELAHAFRLTQLFSLAARVSFGTDADTTSGFYSIRAPIVSLGVRGRSRSANYWIEFGARLIPNWEGPHDSEPAALRLALDATLSSGGADDARWLPFQAVGAQLYGASQARTDPWETSAATLLLGTVYGAQASLAPMVVRSWLGPQTGVIGNAFAEIFVGLPVIRKIRMNLQFGVHGEVSLSSIWPGDDPFPAQGTVFAAWSPESWFAIRGFVGVAGSPGGAVATTYPYGIRMEFFLP